MSNQPKLSLLSQRFYTIRNTRIVLLLAGGDKSSQSKDIRKARQMMTKLE